MNDKPDIFNINIFVGLDTPAPTPPKPVPTRLDPIAELKAASGPITIEFKTRYQNSNIPFVDMSRGDRRWLSYLLQDLQTIAVASPTDNAIMKTNASARTRFKQLQTWQNFVDDLIADKVNTGHDFTQGQLKHLPKLIAFLSKGTKLKGCGALQFEDTTTGTILK